MKQQQQQLTFNEVFCDADTATVDTLMQIEDDRVDNTADNSRGEEKSENLNENLKIVVNNTMIRQKRKTRRGRNKSARQSQQPYNSETQVLRRRQKMRRAALINAPTNTTQFIMSDRNYSDSDLEKEDHEDDFAAREFSKDYEKMASNKQKLPISKLIEEYFMYEAEVKELEKKYQEMTTHEELKARMGNVNYDWEKGEIFMEPEVAEKIRIFHEEIAKVREENRVLEQENSSLGSQGESEDSSELSSSDTSDDDDDESSSSDSSSSDSSDSSSDDDDDDVDEAGDDDNAAVPTSTVDGAGDSEQRVDEPGYESTEENSSDRVTSTSFRK